MQGYNDNSNIHRSEQFKKSQHFELDFYNKLTVYSGSCKLYEYEFMPKSWESPTLHPQSQSAGFNLLETVLIMTCLRSSRASWQKQLVLCKLNSPFSDFLSDRPFDSSPSSTDAPHPMFNLLVWICPQFSTSVERALFFILLQRELPSRHSAKADEIMSNIASAIISRR